MLTHIIGIACNNRNEDDIEIELVEAIAGEKHFDCKECLRILRDNQKHSRPFLEEDDE